MTVNTLLALPLIVTLASTGVFNQEAFGTPQFTNKSTNRLTIEYRVKADSNSTNNYNKTFHLSSGIGSELSYLNAGINIYEGFYLTANVGQIPIPDDKAWFGEHLAKFYKIGILWRTTSDENTFIVGLEMGEARLYVQDSFDFLYIPNLARIGSVLGGYEWRYSNGITLGLCAGVNYSRRQIKPGFLRPGVLFNVGWSF